MEGRSGMEIMEIGKNILVTGGNGFIGGHLVNHLVAKKYKVIVPYIEVQNKSFFSSNDLHKKTIFVKCDLRNFAKTKELISKNKIDFIFHLAAQPIVDKAIENPIETFESNIMGTVHTLEAARAWGKVRGIIVTSSDKAYGKIPKAKETKPLSGDHPYEVSKASADLIASTYSKTYGMPIVVTRFGNVYGEGDLNFNRIVPGIIKSLVHNSDLEVRSDGQYVRDYVYVGDIVEACVLLAQNVKKLSGEAFNISSRENLSVLGLIEQIEKILNMKVKYKILNKARNEIPRQSVDFGKIKSALGWYPKHNLKSTSENIYEWYKNYFY